MTRIRQNIVGGTRPAAKHKANDIVVVFPFCYGDSVHHAGCKEYCVIAKQTESPPKACQRPSSKIVNTNICYICRGLVIVSMSNFGPPIRFTIWETGLAYGSKVLSMQLPTPHSYAHHMSTLHRLATMHNATGRRQTD